MLSKKTTINEIIDLYDENERLKQELKRYTEKHPCECNAKNAEDDKEKIFNQLDFDAKRLLFKHVIYDYELRYSNIEVKEDDGELNFLTFEQWLKSLRVKDLLLSDYMNLLNDLTANEIKNYFRPQFEEYFKKRVNDKKMEILRSKKEENK